MSDDFHSTDGVSAKMVDSLGDIEGQPSAPQAFAAPTATPYEQSLVGHEPSGPCKDCQEQISMLRGVLIVLAIIIGILAAIYLAQRRGHQHGNEDSSPPVADD